MLVRRPMASPQRPAAGSSWQQLAPHSESAGLASAFDSDRLIPAYHGTYPFWPLWSPRSIITVTSPPPSISCCLTPHQHRHQTEFGPSPSSSDAASLVPYSASLRPNTRVCSSALCRSLLLRKPSGHRLLGLACQATQLACSVSFIRNKLIHPRARPSYFWPRLCTPARNPPTHRYPKVSPHRPPHQVPLRLHSSGSLCAERHKFSCLDYR